MTVHDYKLNLASVEDFSAKLFSEMAQRSSVIIYHKDCPDGSGSAALFVIKLQSMGFAIDRKITEEQRRQGFLSMVKKDAIGVESIRVDFVAREYSEGRKLPEYQDKLVVVVDFSLKTEPQTDNFHKVALGASTIFWLDHHAGAWAQFEKDCALHNGVPANMWYCFHQGKAGVKLSWETCFPGQPSPLLVDYLQDRDLNTWQLPQAKEFLLGFDQDHVTNDVEGYADALISYVYAFSGNNDPEAVRYFDSNVQEGKAILKARVDLVAQACQRAIPISIMGKSGYIVGMQRVLAHDAAMLLASREDADFGATFEIESPTRVKVSFRGNNHRTDRDQQVLPYAVKYNGGGHPYAAACYMDMATFSALIASKADDSCT